MHAHYGRDLAHVQATGFGADAAASAPVLIDLLRQHGIGAGTVVDLGCGAGVTLAALTAAGYDAYGIEPSAQLAGRARKAAPDARVTVGSMETAVLPPCDAVLAIGEVLGYLPPVGRAMPLARLFRRLYAALRPGGVLLFDMLLADRRHSMAYRNWVDGPDWSVLTEVSENVRKGRLVRNVVIYRRVGRSYRRSDERHVLRVPAKAYVIDALRAAGFTRFRTIRADGWADRPRRAGFVAVKAA